MQIRRNVSIFSLSLSLSSSRRRRRSDCRSPLPVRHCRRSHSERVSLLFGAFDKSRCYCWRRWRVFQHGKRNIFYNIFHSIPFHALYVRTRENRHHPFTQISVKTVSRAARERTADRATPSSSARRGLPATSSLRDALYCLLKMKLK